MIYLQDLTQELLAEHLLPRSKTPSQAKYRATQIFKWFYERGVSSWDEMTDLSLGLRSWLKENISVYALKEKTVQKSEDGTTKFLWELEDHKTIESVLIPSEPNDPRRLTLCISSQVGCAMGCTFCLTGIQGLDRNLKTYEIVSQVWEIKKFFPITNIVFMGMGEPLHNVGNVIRACQILIDQQGLNFSKRKVTVSTSGLVPAIQKLGDAINVNLAISLNATEDELRDKIMPINRKWNIRKLLAACREYPVGNFRRVTFEYVLLRDLNDSLADADRLSQMLRGVRNKVNVIPFNEHPGSEFGRPSDESVDRFHKRLLSKGLTATIRRSKGRDILAACGQLRSLAGSARGTEKHRDPQYFSS